MASQRPLPALLFATFLACLEGCAASAVDAGAEADPAALTAIDETGNDVQVLQVWTPGRLLPLPGRSWLGSGPNDVVIDASDRASCTPLRSSSTTPGSGTYTDDEVDCTDAIARAMPFDVTEVPGPMMTPARFMVTRRTSDGYLTVDPDYCSRIELRAVVRDAALAQPSFAGIGFWSGRGDRFTPKADLQAVGHVSLANGDAATVFRFAGISTCISSSHSSTSGNLYQTFSFKPYAAYDRADGADTRRHRVWEDLRGRNHVIGRSWPGNSPAVDALGFDRQDELLAR